MAVKKQTDISPAADAPPPNGFGKRGLTALAVAAAVAAFEGEFGPTEELHGHNSTAFWREVRDVLPFAGDTRIVWKISVPPSDGARVADLLDGDAFLDWGGGLIWYAGPGDAGTVRAACHPGHATLIRRAGLDGPAFPPLAGKLAALSAGLRQVFDPAGIFNSGLMDR